MGDRTGASAESSDASAGGGDVAVLTEDEHTLVILHGDIDVRVADDLEHAGRYSIDAGQPTLMDVRRVEMIDSVGISFVVRLGAGLRAAGTELVLRGPCPRVAELITLLGADGLVRWVTAPQAGLAPDDGALLEREIPQQTARGGQT